MNLRRRGFLAGLGAALAAPAIVRTAGLLMPIRPAIIEPEGWDVIITDVHAWQGGAFEIDVNDGFEMPPGWRFITARQDENGVELYRDGVRLPDDMQPGWIDEAGRWYRRDE